MGSGIAEVIDLWGVGAVAVGFGVESVGVMEGGGLAGLKAINKGEKILDSRCRRFRWFERLASVSGIFSFLLKLQLKKILLGTSTVRIKFINNFS